MNEKNTIINEFSYDPVTAITENNAPKNITIIFDDIKKTMGIPIVTSIWRGLADMDGSLIKVWSLTKPIFQNGEPEFIYNKLFQQLSLPSPPKITLNTLDDYEININDMNDIKNIIFVYNRSNTMNLIALSALVNSNFSYILNTKTFKKTNINYSLPSLLEKENINDSTWQIIKNINAYGSINGIDSHVATLWRHLAYWPNFLDLVEKNFKPLKENGLIEQSLETVLNYILKNKINIKNNPKNSHSLNKLTVSTVSNYVHSKYQVVRMVSLGIIMHNWLSNI